MSTPEATARENIDRQLEAAGWSVQDKNAINLFAGQGQAIREYHTDSGPADYVLFLVNTRNLAEQAEQEFLAYTPPDDNRKFTELYTVQRLTSRHVPADAQVCICTIQRMYSILQGRDLDESAEDEHPAERSGRKREPIPVSYNEKVPPEFFDFMVIDECHQSIYNLWRQVVEYFDVFHIGLTATPDSHADDIINIVREVFDEGNQFCKKLTYKTEEDPKSVLSQFRNEYHPRIAVTVDMIATGTDVKPLECLLFMRDVKSRGYFEQMKGRGTRTLDHDGLKKVSSAAKSAKTHYVIVDAIGVNNSLKTASRPPITKPSVPFKDLAMEVVMGAADADTVSSLAGRLARIERQLTTPR